MHKIDFLDNKKIWNKFLSKNQYQSFLQNYEWGEVEKSLNREIIRLGIYNSQTEDDALTDTDLIGVCQIIGYKARRGNFLLIPHGPILMDSTELSNTMPTIINFLKSNNYHKKYSFLRLNSSISLSDYNRLRELKNNGFYIAPMFSVSENMWVKNLQKSENELLNEMSSAHKKLILESLRKPYLEISTEKGISKIDGFWKIYSELAKRKEFTPYSYNLIKSEFELFACDGNAKLYFGKIEGKIVSAALIIYSNNIAFYHHGASLSIKEPINYKLHWQIMLDAKQIGCDSYHMWGITLRSNINHPWRGLTQFKKGFGGELIQFLPAMDYVFSKKYWLNYLVEKFRRKIKKL